MGGLPRTQPHPPRRPRSYRQFSGSAIVRHGDIVCEQDEDRKIASNNEALTEILFSEPLLLELRGVEGGQTGR
jgi:hypothetical protein